jgi:uncharacterized membrane protein YjjP (DUF1212 family)
MRKFFGIFLVVFGAFLILLSLAALIITFGWYKNYNTHAIAFGIGYIIGTFILPAGVITLAVVLIHTGRKLINPAYPNRDLNKPYKH